MHRDPHRDQGCAEDYVRGLLDERESTEFEAHVLECDRCFREVQVAERYVTGVRALLDGPSGEAPATRRGARWLSLLAPRPALAFAASAVVLVAAGMGWWLFGTQRRPAAPTGVAFLERAYQADPSAYLALTPAGATLRGPEDLTGPVSRERLSDGRLVLFFHDPQARPTVRLSARLEDRNDGVVLRGLKPLPLPGTDPPLYGVVLESGGLSPGIYRLVVTAAGADGEADIGFAWFDLAP